MNTAREIFLANKKFAGKRVYVFSNYDEEWHGGLVKNITTNMFDEHGIILYIGRSPVYDIVLKSIFEMGNSIENIDLKREMERKLNLKSNRR